MRRDSFYQAQNIDLKLGADVNAIDVRSREVGLDDGSRLAFDHLLLATGSEPVRPSIPGADQPRVHTLRSLKDCRASACILWIFFDPDTLLLGRFLWFGGAAGEKSCVVGSP
jgi:NAD(P)H-nitrite reductase large subunit